MKRQIFPVLIATALILPALILTGCSSIPKAPQPAMDEIRMKNDLPNKLVVIVNDFAGSKGTGGKFYIVTNKEDILALKANYMGLASMFIRDLGNSAAIQYLGSEPRFIGAFDNIKADLRKRGAVYLSGLGETSVGYPCFIAAAFSLNPDVNEIGIFIDASYDAWDIVSSSDVTHFDWDILSIDVQPDKDEQFYVITGSTGKLKVQEVGDISPYLKTKKGLFGNKVFYPSAFNEKGEIQVKQTGFISFDPPK
jgi:hypothetical protein